MKARYLVAFAVVAAQLAPLRADTTLIVEAAPAAGGPWQVVPIGPEALDMKGGIIWQGLPEELRFVRVRVIKPKVTDVSCTCDACSGIKETE